MNAPRDLERDLTRWMAAVVPTQAPDELVPSIVARTRSTRPRPGWLARLLEPPMQTQLSLKRYFGTGRSQRLIVAGLLIIALVAGGIVVGSQLLRQRALPAPFGVAGNGLIAVTLTVSSPDGAIVLMEPDGSNQRPLALPFSGLSQPSFSRDGTRLAAWATPNPAFPARKSLIVANVDGSGALELDATNLVTEPGNRIAWSPDDRRLAYSGSGDHSFVADIETRSVREIGTDESIKHRKDPAWAPDGRLAYQCTTADGVLHLCLMSADFQIERILETSPGTEFGFQLPSWSHDGRSIAYQIDDTIDHGGVAEGYDVATIDVATGAERVLTQGVRDAIFPVWSPDDEHVLFLTEAGPGVVRSDGSGLQLFKDGGCAGFEPSPDGAFITCVIGDRVMLYPIGAGQPKVIQLASPAELGSWQRLAH